MRGTYKSPLSPPLVQPVPCTFQRCIAGELLRIVVGVEVEVRRTPFRDLMLHLPKCRNEEDRVSKHLQFFLPLSLSRQIILPYLFIFAEIVVSVTCSSTRIFEIESFEVVERLRCTVSEFGCDNLGQKLEELSLSE